MALQNIPDETKQLLNQHKAEIKGEYITLMLFLDSAVKSKLRSMKIKTPPDLIIGHLNRLAKSKQTHLDRQSVYHTLAKHKRRVGRAKQYLDSLED